MCDRRARTVFFAALAATGGMVFQFGGCFSGTLRYIGNFNPCGTILACDPVTYRFIQSGYEGPGADPEVDPFCTWPPFCGRDNDPLSP